MSEGYRLFLFMMKMTMSRPGRMRVFSMILFCGGCTAIGVHAQSFDISFPDVVNGVVVAGRPYLATVTRMNGGATDTTYTGSHTLDITYTGAVVPELCIPNGGSCSPPAGACAAASSQSLTFDNKGVANVCLSIRDVATFTLGLKDPNVPAENFSFSPSLRSRPSYFELTATSVISPAITLTPFINRGELYDLGGCNEATFSYMGERIDFVFQLTAKNDAGDSTDAYEGSVGQFDQANIEYPSTWITQGASDSMGLWMMAIGYPVGSGTCNAIFSKDKVGTSWPTTFVCTSNVVTPPATINRAAGPRVTVLSDPKPKMDWKKAVGTFTVSVQLERADNPDGPYDSLQIGIAPRDKDGVALNTLNMDADNDGSNERAIVTKAKLRYGRLKVSNSYGSELLPLPVPVQAQYWNGAAYVANTDDNCTPVKTANFAVTAGPGVAITTSATGTSTLDSSGKGQITLIKPNPTPAGKGAVNVTSTLPYLPGEGRATFGVYKGGPVIYRRELHF